MTSTVLYVCTGNVCRSPAAEALLRTRVGSRVSVQSAGLDALVGEGVDDATAAALRLRGLEVTQHRARQFHPAMAAYADVILTAERAQRDLVMAHVPSVHRRVFTMREFQRLESRARSRPHRDAVLELADLRGIDGFVAADEDDVPDAYRADEAFASAVVEQIAHTVDAVARLLASDPRHRPRPYRRAPQEPSPGTL